MAKDQNRECFFEIEYLLQDKFRLKLYNSQFYLSNSSQLFQIKSGGEVLGSYYEMNFSFDETSLPLHFDNNRLKSDDGTLVLLNDRLVIISDNFLKEMMNQEGNHFKLRKFLSYPIFKKVHLRWQLTDQKIKNSRSLLFKIRGEFLNSKNQEILPYLTP